MSCNEIERKRERERGIERERERERERGIEERNGNKRNVDVYCVVTYKILI